MSSIFNIPQEQAKLSGIYVIRNTTNNKIYVGSAVNLQNRFWIHFSRLRANNHINKHLQASFNKNGENSFTFNLLEIVEDKDELINREQHYIDTLQPHYNIAKQAGRPPLVEWTDEMRQKHSDMMRNRVLPKETKAKILDALNRGRANYFARPEEDRVEHRKKISQALTGRTLSEEHRKKCGLAMLGKKLTEEHKQQIREVHSKDYIVISPTGEHHEISGLFLFAQQYELDESALASCARGEYKHHKGWQCFRVEDFSEDKIQDPTTFHIKGVTTYIVTKPDGTEETTTNLYEFARQNGLDGSSMRKVVLGKLAHYKQYRVREEGTELQPLPKRKKPTIDPTNTHHFVCTAPDGTEYTTTNMPEFAREHGICKEAMRNAAKGRLRQYKGWLCRYTPETLAKLTPEQQAEVQANFAYQAQYPDGKPQSPEDRQRMIDLSRTPEALAKRSASRKGKRPNAEQLQNLSLGHCKRTFVVTTPEGEEIITKQLVQFAKSVGSHGSGFYKSLKTGQPHKGYTVREITDQQQSVV
jgi:group I intron endonuclease